MNDEATADPAQGPLVVDLDGTLIRTDVLYESLARLLHLNPLYAFLVPLWLGRGRAHLKRQVAQRASLNVQRLPYRQDVLSYLREQARGGRELVLATTTDALIADEVAAHLGIFSRVLASDGTTNLKGEAKAGRLQSIFGERGFTYVGNDWADVPVWRAAGSGVVVSANRRLAEQVARVTPIERMFMQPATGLRSLIKALRLDQWVKNVLVFVPLFAAHRAAELPLLGTASVAFIAFGLVASAGYLVNDLADIEVDRLSERKRQRPFASGTLDFRVGLAAVPLLALGGIGLGFSLSWLVALALIGYFGSAVLYTFLLKKIALADVFTLAILYTSRLVVGALAVAVPLSQWMLAFSVFFFLCLAFAKRYSELRELRTRKLHQAEGRGYLAEDFELLASLGAGSGFIAVLVLALYINSPEVAVLYRTPATLWLACLVLLYWISRLWIIAHRGTLDEDPIVFAIKDRTSYLAATLIGAAVVAGI